MIGAGTLLAASILESWLVPGIAVVWVWRGDLGSGVVAMTQQKTMQERFNDGDMPSPDPSHPPSDERDAREEAEARKYWKSRGGYTRAANREASLLRRLDAARLALSGAQAKTQAAIEGRNDYCVQYKRVSKELHAAQVALSGAQKEVALRDAEIERLKDELRANAIKIAWLGTELQGMAAYVKHWQLERDKLAGDMNAVVNTPPGADAMVIAQGILSKTLGQAPFPPAVEAVARAIEAAAVLGAAQMRERAYVAIAGILCKNRGEIEVLERAVTRIRGLPNRKE